MNNLDPADFTGLRVRKNRVKHGNQWGKANTCRKKDNRCSRVVQKEVTKGECNLNRVTLVETIVEEIGEAPRVFLRRATPFPPN